MIIGLGNTGTNIVKAASASSLLTDVTMYAIDSVATSIELDTINNINIIPIISDDKSGSGRNRERGRAMYEYHESQGAFKAMYDDAVNSKSPVLVITSAAGGTGSGSAVPVCKALLELGIEVIPIIICPNKNDPMAFHLNTNDLLMELGEIGIETYSTFENRKGDANYGPINSDVVNLIEIIFGKRYGKTTLDSIDDSDLDVILNKPGRFIAVSAEASTIPALSKEITRKLFGGFQPAWSANQVPANTLITAFSLTSMFAETDFRAVFDEITSRLDPDTIYDEYRNIVNDDNNGISNASIIIAGLPRPDVKEINSEYKEVDGLGDGMKKSHRPNFMNRKKASSSTSTDASGNVIDRFKWKK
jgi:hypothetical protein